MTLYAYSPMPESPIFYSWVCFVSKIEGSAILIGTDQGDGHAAYTRAAGATDALNIIFSRVPGIS
jgi:hypothetical protein